MAAALHWVREHDDRLSFVVLYVGGAIALSIWFNLFAVAMLMLAHFGLEILRGHLLKADRPLLHAAWEVKLDIALLLFSLAVALYSEHVMALLGLGQAARAGQAARGMQFAARFGIIERALRIILLTVDDIARLVQALIKFRRQRNGAPEPSFAAVVSAHGAPEEGRGNGDALSLAFGALCLALILLAPSLTGEGAADVGAHVLRELSPYR
jgi:hypothetical protein